MAESDLPEMFQQMEETLARLRNAPDDETRLALLREMARLLTEAHAILRRVA